MPSLFGESALPLLLGVIDAESLEDDPLGLLERLEGLVSELDAGLPGLILIIDDRGHLLLDHLRLGVDLLGEVRGVGVGRRVHDRSREILGLDREIGDVRFYFFRDTLSS